MTTAVATDVPVENLLTVLSTDFAAACAGFALARSKQRGKDTPDHRAAVAEARDRVDAVLDIYLEVRGATGAAA
jgi:hypothetical protein